MKVSTALGIALLLTIGGSIYFMATSQRMQAEPNITAEPDTFDTQTPPVATIEATFMCAAGKSITAGFSAEIVTIALSDGRTYTLEQTVSASGARYANDGDQIVFWNKGNTAFVEENGTTTFTDCIEEVVDTAGAVEPMVAEGTPENEQDADMIGSVDE
jgi:membrane-bound inhibitor of C-type lysozyme